MRIVWLAPIFAAATAALALGTAGPAAAEQVGEWSIVEGSGSCIGYLGPDAIAAATLPMAKPRSITLTVTGPREGTFRWSGVELGEAPPAITNVQLGFFGPEGLVGERETLVDLRPDEVSVPMTPELWDLVWQSDAVGMRFGETGLVAPLAGGGKALGEALTACLEK